MISMRAVAFSFEKPAFNALPGTLPSSQCRAELDPLDGSEAWQQGGLVSTSGTGWVAITLRCTATEGALRAPHSIIMTV